MRDLSAGALSVLEKMRDGWVLRGSVHGPHGAARFWLERDGAQQPAHLWHARALKARGLIESAGEPRAFRVSAKGLEVGR